MTYQASGASALHNVRHNKGRLPRCDGGLLLTEAAVPLIIATMLREEGGTGVHTHVRQLRRHLKERGMGATLVTPFSWGRMLAIPVFGLRLAMAQFSRPAGDS